MSSVRNSRAGDDFHYLWAARRCLDLVDPRSDLQLLRVEGPTPEDSPDDDDLFLGVDLIEYFGGESAASASRVLISQLKYSTAHPSRPWTMARLTARAKGRRGASNRSSVIGRLADAWKGVVAKGATDVGVALVSNQPAHPTFVRMVDDLSASARSVATVAALRRSHPNHDAAITKLLSASGLGSRQFVSFVSSLDLSNCGARPRALQKLDLRRGVGGLAAASPGRAAGDLVDLVRATVMPEFSQSAGLRRDDVLAQLDVLERDLFPAWSRFDAVPTDAVSTADAPLVANALGANGDRRFLAHGSYGVGKTTTVQQLEQHLPSGSVVIAYDCFGQGDYRSPATPRHLVDVAITQMANEVCLRCSMQPVPTHGATDRVIWSRFAGVVESAAEGLEPGALLVFAVDAADNARFASRLAGEPSFVDQIWHLDLPENVRLLLTCRTDQRSDVLPDTDPAAAPRISELELRGFDQLASVEMLRRAFPQASDEDGVRFHGLTSGNPRLQTYAMAAGGPTIEAVLTTAHAGLDTIFADMVDQALARLSSSPGSLDALAVMHAMTPPARISVLADVLETDTQSARALCGSLAPGVVIEADKYGFRDQSFDDFVRDRLSDERRESAHRQLAKYFLARQHDPYAAAAVAGHLYNGGELGAVIELALDRADLGLDDPLWGADVARRRLHYAMRAATDGQDVATMARLLLAAAHLSRSDATLVATMREWPELAERFADPDLVALIHDREESDSWLGPSLLRTARLLAWQEGREDDTRRRLQLADAWLARWSRMSKEDRRTWDLDSVDAAAGVEAVFALRGVDDAVAEIYRWRPAAFRFELSLDLVRSLTLRLSPGVLQRELEHARASCILHSAAIGSFVGSGVSVPRAWVKATARRLLAVPQRHTAFAEPVEWGTAFCMAAAIAGVSQAEVAALVDRLGVPMPRHAPGEYDDLERLIEPLMCVSLRHLGKHATIDVNELVASLVPLPAAEVDATASERARLAQSRRDYAEAVGLLLPLIRLRLSLLRGRGASERVDDVIGPPLERFVKDGPRWWFNGRPRFVTWLKLVAVTSSAAGADGRSALERCLLSLDVIAGPGAPQLRLALGATLTAGEIHTGVGESLVERGAAEVSAAVGMASERRDALLRAAQTVLRVDEALAERCFRDAIAVARDIDDDVIPEIAVASRLASTCVDLSEADRISISGQLVNAIDGAVGRVSDDEYLPVRRVLDATARLALGASLAALTKWHQTGLAEAEDGCPVIATAALATGGLDPMDAATLARLSRSPHVALDAMLSAYTALAGEVDRLADLQRLAAQLVLFVGRDVEASRRPHAARTALAVLESQSPNPGEPIENLRSIARLCPQTTEQRVEVDASSEEQPDNTPPDLSTAQAITDYLATDGVRYKSAAEIQQVLTESLQSTLPRHRIEVLDRLEAAMEEARRPSVRALVATIEAVASDWSASPRVKEWLDRFQAEMPTDRLPDLFSVDGDQLDNWRVSLVLAPSPTARAGVLTAVAIHLAAFNDSELYALAEYLAAGADDNTRLGMAQSILDTMETTPKETGPAEPSGAALATACWALLRTRDQRTRWRVAHVARSLLTTSPDPDLVSAWNTLLTQPNPSRVDPLNPTMSGLLWGWMVTARAIDEAPSRFRGIEAAAAQVATDPLFPHAGVREFARRSAIRLSVILGSNTGGDTELHLANQPSVCQVKQRTHYDSGDAFSAGKEATFGFDSMDTIRYWYSRLAQVFGLSTAEIVTRADRWVTEVWGVTNEQCADDHSALAPRYRYDLLSNDQGRVPLVETLQSHVEYHAMLAVAGELVDEGVAMVCEPYESAKDSWQEWISRYTDVSEAWWLADRVGPVPLDATSYGQVKPADIWKRIPDSPDELWDLLELEEGWMCGKGHVGWEDSDDHVNVWVSSSLVTPETGSALVRAIMASPTASSSMPMQGEDDTHDGEISVSGFLLRGWVRDEYLSREGLEENDQEVDGANPALVAPSDELIARLGLASDRAQTVYVDLADSVAATHQVWVYRRAGESPPISDGSRLLIRTGDLMRFAADEGLDVIVSMSMDRFTRDATADEGDDDDGRYRRVRRVWTLKANEKPKGDA